MGVEYRELRALSELRAVAQLEREIWGVPEEELVPATLLVVAIECGALMIGAFEDGRLVGFTYSFPGERHGRPLHWSHVTGVQRGLRRRGVGRELKAKQRAGVLARGRDLIEWTFDPLQAGNALFNFRTLGIVAREYLVDAYGVTSSPLHGPVPTDRFVAQWWLHADRVQARVSAGALAGGSAVSWRPQATDAPNARVANPVTRVGEWWRCDEPVLPADGPAWLVNVPPDYTRMLSEAPDLALEWRLRTRRVFESAFAAGFVAEAFVPNADGGGRYLFTVREEQP